MFGSAYHSWREPAPRRDTPPATTVAEEGTTAGSSNDGVPAQGNDIVFSGTKPPCNAQPIEVDDEEDEDDITFAGIKPAPDEVDDKDEVEVDDEAEEDIELGGVNPAELIEVDDEDSDDDQADIVFTRVNPGELIEVDDGDEDEDEDEDKQDIAFSHTTPPTNVTDDDEDDTIIFTHMTPAIQSTKIETEEEGIVFSGMTPATHGVSLKEEDIEILAPFPDRTSPRCSPGEPSRSRSPLFLNMPGPTPPRERLSRDRSAVSGWGWLYTQSSEPSRPSPPSGTPSSISSNFQRDPALPHIVVDRPRKYHVIPRAPVPGSGGVGRGCVVLSRGIRARILHVFLGNAQDFANPIRHISLLYPELNSAEAITSAVGANSEDKDDVIATAAHFQLYAAGYTLQHRPLNHSQLTVLPTWIQGNIMELLIGMCAPRGERHMEHLMTLFPEANSWAAITNWIGANPEDMERVRHAAAWLRTSVVQTVKQGEIIGFGVRD